MNKQIFSYIKVSALVLALSLGASYAYAWIAPSVAAPGGNVNAPINTGTTAQTKAGGLTVGGLTLPSGSTITGGGANSKYGSLTVNGSKGGYAGINFPGAGTVMMHPSYSGFYNAADNAWRWYVTDGGNSVQSGSITAGNIAGGDIAGSKITAPSHCIGLACIIAWPAAYTVGAGLGLTGSALGLNVANLSAGCTSASGVGKLYWNGSALACGTDQLGGAGGITGITGGGGVTASAPVSGVVTLGTDTNTLQKRVAAAGCAVGSSIRVINADGTVSCEFDDVGGGSPAITSFSATPNPVAFTGDLTLYWTSANTASCSISSSGGFQYFSAGGLASSGAYIFTNVQGIGGSTNFVLTCGTATQTIAVKGLNTTNSGGAVIGRGTAGRLTKWFDAAGSLVDSNLSQDAAGNITVSGGIFGLKSDNTPALKWTSGNNIADDASGNMSIRTNQLFITNKTGGNGAFTVQGDTHLAGYAWIDGGIFGLKSNNTPALTWTSGNNIADDASGNMSIRTNQLFITNKTGGNGAFTVQGDTHLAGDVRVGGKIYNATDVCTAAGKCLGAISGGGGVTSLTAGTGITLSGSTGAVTVTAKNVDANGRISAKAGDNGESGYAMVNPTGKIGRWNAYSGYLEVMINGAAMGVTTWASDIKYKSNIQDASRSALADIEKINFKSFHHDNENSDWDIGIIAQDLEKIDKNYVNVMSDGTLNPSIPRLLTMGLKGIQELNTQLNELSSQNIALKEENSNLKGQVARILERLEVLEK